VYLFIEVPPFLRNRGSIGSSVTIVKIGVDGNWQG
jgi:hypothetical protein